MFNNQTVIVTGGSDGIGRGCVELFSEKEANVVIADVNEINGAELAAQLQGKGLSAHFIKCDVSNFADVEAMIAKTINLYGQLDILVNNAGITTPPCFGTDLENEDWCRLVDVHLHGSFFCTKLAAREMKKRKYGRIINLSSLGALVGLIGQSSYAAVKGALTSFTYNIAKELSPFGITVNAVQPGLIRSNITTPVIDALGSQLIDQIPAARIGEPEDVAELIVFLASPRAGYITGECVRIDGGYMLNLAVLDNFMSKASSGEL